MHQKIKALYGLTLVGGSGQVKYIDSAKKPSLSSWTGMLVTSIILQQLLPKAYMKTSGPSTDGRVVEECLVHDLERNEMPNWIREQMCDLEYDEDIANKVANVFASFTRPVLMEMSYENTASDLTTAKIDESIARAAARGLFNRIQKDIAQPQPVQSDVPENVKAFARALDDAELDGQILKTETGSFKLEQDSEIWDEKQFYVRGCYTEIADIMFKRKPHRMSLLGSSGIGKSNFMVYLIWRRFHDDELKEFPAFLHQSDIIHRFQKGEEPKKVDADTLYSAPQQALYIMDADIDVEHGVFCQSLWITSARRPETPASKAEHFKKAERFSGQFFMPPWTLKEMLNAEVMDLHELNESVVEERFGIFGGTARLVLERDETRAVNDKERLVEAVQSADALQCLKVSSDMKAISKTTHLLVKIHPKREFSWFDVQLSSPYVRQELVKQNRTKRAQALWDRIDDGMMTGIGFALFEEEFHQFMQDKSIGKFKLRARF
ncbi:unnamed protein product [Symbiodinium sp. CCMP2592]|nr:unnamed protein product [Symbiodinium sp. CCMP2592]